MVFADSKETFPNIDAKQIGNLITQKTKALVIIHYGGVACDLDLIKKVCNEAGIWLIEDAAQGIGASYKGHPLGSFGKMAAFSFHETKNISSGEGGLLVVNDPALTDRAEIIWEKGTNRAAFHRGEVARYEWVDIGSSFLPSDLTAAFLYAQLQHLYEINEKRQKIWQFYYHSLQPLAESGKCSLPEIPDFADHNSHIFFVLTRTGKERNELQLFLHKAGIHAVFHYQPLHESPFYHDRHDGRALPNAEKFAACLLRLPLFNSMTLSEAGYVCDHLFKFFQK
jgi:dTDP-4-amino-4,6-dideoxygalactose transaminase